MKVYNITILAKDCCIKLKVSTYMNGMRPSFLQILACFAYEWQCMTMCTCIIPNSQLTGWVGGNGPVHVEKKINKWNNIIIYPHRRNYTDEGLKYDNISQWMSCQIESVHLHEWHVTKFLTNSLMFAYEWQCTTMCTSIILIVNLPTE